MALRKVNKAETAEKVLDVNASMQGTMVFKDPVNLRINGRFEGSLDTKGKLTIGEDAEVIANIIGDDITIAGKVTGNIHSKTRLSLTGTGYIDGDVDTTALNIDEGGVFNGRCQMSSLSGASNATVRKRTMNLDEVARYLEVDSSLVHEWASQKKVPAVKDGNVWKFNKDEIDQWVAREKVGR